MQRVELLDNPDIAKLTDLLRRSSCATEPAEMLSILGPWLQGLRNADFFITVSRRGLGEGEYKITRVVEHPREVTRRGENSNPWRDWSKITSHTGGLVGELLASEHPQLVQNLDVQDDPVLGIAVRTMRSVLAIPNYDGGEALNWAIFFRADPEGWGPGEITPLMQDLNLMGMATKNLVEKRRAEGLNERYMLQLEQVAQVQRSLLPERTPSIPSLKIATSYLTSDEAGGDYYDFISLPDGNLGILIADVAGHGPAAATVMAMLRAILICFEEQHHDPVLVMQYCNSKLSAANLGGSFTTAFFASLNPATGELTYTRWGHNPPRLRRMGGFVEPLDRAGSLPLGIDPDAVGDCHTLTLNPGDTVVLYTDGITEASAPLGAHGRRDMFTTERFDDAIQECSGDPECIIDSVHAALYKHVGSMTRDDDQTLVAVRYLGQGLGDGHA
ncbi:MAG: sigma-B regulation protein RsbU (phosphoserine phosphatase) [Phycisphaerales bacterium]